MNFQLPAAIPELPVTNLDNSIDYYKKCLGFSVDWQYEDGICGVSNGNMCLFLNKRKLMKQEKPQYGLTWKAKSRWINYITNGLKTGQRYFLLLKQNPGGCMSLQLPIPIKIKYGYILI
jgi:hypothetical protein